MVITESVLNAIMAAKIPWPIKVTAINANGIWMQHYELSQVYNG
jgi:hypothetical protein